MEIDKGHRGKRHRTHSDCVDLGLVEGDLVLDLETRPHKKELKTDTHQHRGDDDPILGPDLRNTFEFGRTRYLAPRFHRSLERGESSRRKIDGRVLDWGTQT